MREPSSSHSAASVRIGRLARELCGGNPDFVPMEFDTLGSLATTHESQGSNMGWRTAFGRRDRCDSGGPHLTARTSEAVRQHHGGGARDETASVGPTKAIARADQRWSIVRLSRGRAQLSHGGCT